MSTIVIKGFIATTNPVKSYGGVALPEDAMYYIAKEIRDGKMPMHAHHDERHQLNPHLLVVDVRRTDSNHMGVWIEFEIDEQEWKQYGSLNGFSIAVVSDFTRPDPTDTKPALKIYADAGFYDVDTLQEAVSLLKQEFAVESGRLYQFNILPPAKIVIELTLSTLQSIPANMLSSILYDSIKVMIYKLKRNKNNPPTIEAVTCIRIVRETEQIDVMQVNTNDPDVLKEAMSSFYKNISVNALPGQQGNTLEYDNKSRKWKKHR